MDDIHLHTVHRIPAIPLFGGLAGRKLAQVLLGERLGLNLVPGTSPHANLHLVVRVVGARVEDVYFVILEACADVPFP